MSILLWALSILGGLSGIAFLYFGVRSMCKWLWPGAEDWRGYLSESRDELKGENTKTWKFNCKQEVGQSFSLDIRKHKGGGKARLISRIKFLQGRGHQWDCPSEYRMIIQGKGGIIKELDGKAGKPWEGERYKGIDEEFEPLLVEWIVVSITKPCEKRQAECWATNDIRITEVRFPWLPTWHWLSWLRQRRIS